MPKKFLHRLLPDISRILEQSALGWVRSIAMDPNLLHINRQSVSLAVAIGVFCAFLPLPGQTLIAIFLCYQLRANLALGILLIWISNPITIPPMFYLSYQLGSFLLGIDALPLTVQLSWQWFKSLSADVLLPLFLGSLLYGIFFALCSYLTVLFLWRWQVIKNWEKRRQKRSR